MPPLEFRLFGFPVEVRPAFLVLLGIYALIGLQGGQAAWQILSWWGIVFTSILLHELGHAGMSRAFGVEVHGIQLHGFGGHVTHARSTAGPSLLISLAGPLAGILVGLVFLAIHLSGAWGESITWLLQQLLWVNIGWSILNLLPMRPLDGGQALLAGLWMVLPALAVSIASAVGLLCAAAVIALGLYLNEPFLLLFGGLAGATNIGGLVTARGPEGRS